MSVQYSNLALSTCSYDAIGLKVLDTSNSYYNVERRIFSGSQLIWTDGPALAQQSDTSISGVFRIVRTGTAASSATYTTYLSDGVTPFVTGLGASSGANLPVTIILYGRDDNYGCSASGQFSNFVLQ